MLYYIGTKVNNIEAAKMQAVKQPSEIEIHSRPAACLWLALKDRKDNDKKNQVYWTSAQVASMVKLRLSFMRAYGEDNVVMNINQKFFTFKVFRPKEGKTALLDMLKVVMEESSSKPYQWGFNERNQLLYHIYPK